MESDVFPYCNWCVSSWSTRCGKYSNSWYVLNSSISPWKVTYFPIAIDVWVLGGLGVESTPLEDMSSTRQYQYASDAFEGYIIWWYGIHAYIIFGGVGPLPQVFGTYMITKMISIYPLCNSWSTSSSFWVSLLNLLKSFLEAPRLSWTKENQTKPWKSWTSLILSIGKVT